MVKEIKNNDELNMEITKNSDVILKMFTTWCGPCKILKPEFERASEEETEVVFLAADAEEAVDLSKKFNVQSVPTVLYFKDGKFKNKFDGFKPKKAILDFIKTNK